VPNDFDFCSVILLLYASSRDIVLKLRKVCAVDVCRPDLIDWTRVCLQTPRENLQLAFDIAERIYNVTRLLDPEGADNDYDCDDCDQNPQRIFRHY